MYSSGREATRVPASHTIYFLKVKFTMEVGILLDEPNQRYFRCKKYLFYEIFGDYFSLPLASYVIILNDLD